jgi:VanZ family protein
MADRLNQEQVRKLIVRGLGWCLCLGLWTVALLSIFPVEVGAVVVPSSMHFPVAKTLHVSAYAFLTIYLSWMPLRNWRWLLLAFLSLHAAATEYFQQFVPGRHGAVTDVLIDHAGLALGIGLTWKYWLPRFKIASQKAHLGYSTLLRSVANPRQVTTSPLLSSPSAPDTAGDTSIKRCPPQPG